MTRTTLQKPQTSRARLFRLSASALLSALGLILMFLEFPLLPMFAYLKMDFSDLPAILGGVLFGPVYGVLIELVKNLLDLLVKGFGSQMGFGNFQNFLVGSAFVLPLSIFLRQHAAPEGYGAKGLALGCGTGFLSLLAVGFLSNLLVAPLYFRFFVGEAIPLSGALAAAGAASLFNVIKGAILIAVVLAGARFALPPLKKVVDKIR